MARDMHVSMPLHQTDRKYDGQGQTRSDADCSDVLREHDSYKAVWIGDRGNNCKRLGTDSKSA